MTRAHTESELLPLATRKLEQLEALTMVGKTLISSLDLKQVLAEIMRMLSLLLKPDYWSLILVDEQIGDLYFEIAIGEGAEPLKGQRLAWGEGIAGWVAKHQTPIVVPDVAADERFSQRFDEMTNVTTHSIMAVPMLYQETTLGVIELISTTEPTPFDAEQLELMAPFADFAAIAIANARHYAQIQRLTISDDCTSLYNARYLKQMLPIEVRRSRRYKHPVSLIFFDLDHFKEINDTHGHLIGSQLLQEVGEVLKASLREVDIPIRYGGDEFVVILPETSVEGAQAVANRILQAFRSHKFISSQALHLTVSASIGFSTFPDYADNAKQLIESADLAMYKAKNSGRNCIALPQPLSHH